MRERPRARLLAPLVFAGSLTWSLVLTAAPADDNAPVHIDREVSARRDLTLEVGANRLLMLAEPIARASVADPKIVDFKVITQNQLLLTAHATGTTDLTLWNKQEQPVVVALRVHRNLEDLKRQLKELFPGEKLEVSASGDLVVVSGEVTDVRIPERVTEIARLHSDKLVNLVRVSGDQQVQLEVKFAEVSRRGLRAMSFNFFHADLAGRRVGGIVPPPSSTLATPLAIPGTGTGGLPPVYPPGSGNAFSLFFSSLPRFPFSTAVSLLESTGLAKVLAEPTLVALSGQEAKFLAGGEFPVPYAASFGQSSILWKKFGIILNFVPTVIAGDTIQLRLSAEVSDIDAARGVTLGGYFVPGLTSRQSETTVRLSDGQSFAIAGLLSNQIRSQIDKVPLLGDLPILGALFRSIDYRRDESELLVVVTAHLARPVAPHELPPLPTDTEFNDPNDFSLFLLGSDGYARSRQELTSEAQKTESHSLRGPAGEIGFIR